MLFNRRARIYRGVRSLAQAGKHGPVRVRRKNEIKWVKVSERWSESAWNLFSLGLLWMSRFLHIILFLSSNSTSFLFSFNARHNSLCWHWRRNQICCPERSSREIHRRIFQRRWLVLKFRNQSIVFDSPPLFSRQFLSNNPWRWCRTFLGLLEGWYNDKIKKEIKN